MTRSDQEFPDNMPQDMPDDTPQEETTATDNKWHQGANVAKKNWKEWLAFWKLASMPPKGYKKTVGLVNLTPISGKKEKEKKTPEPLKRTPIAKIGKRTKERILQNGTETELFRKIWEERDHTCECGCGEEVKGAFLGKSLIKPQCFAHKLSKGRYPEYRYEPKNIAIVKTIECHHRLDWILAHHDAEIIASFNE